MPLLIIHPDVLEAEGLPLAGCVSGEQVEPIFSRQHVEPELRRSLDVGDPDDGPGVRAAASLTKRRHKRELLGDAQREHGPRGQHEFGFPGEPVGRLKAVGADDPLDSREVKLDVVQSELANHVEPGQVVLARL